MTRTLHTAALAGLIVWWAPTFAVAVFLAAPHLAALYGIPYRVCRVRRLCRRLQFDEAERAAIALERDAIAARRWLKGLRQ